MSGKEHMRICVRNSEIAGMYAGSYEQKGSAGENDTAGTATIVGFPQHNTAVGAEGLHPTHVQCVQGLANQAINRQLSYPVYTVNTTETTYSKVFYKNHSGSTTVVTYSHVERNSIHGTYSGQFLDQKNGAYITEQHADSHTAHIQGAVHRDRPQISVDASGVAHILPGNTTTNPSSARGDRRKNYSHIARISPATYQWLTQNFELAEGESLPRSTAYKHYLRHCKEEKKDPVSAAIFGKKLLAVFRKLKSRRLGARGKTKYHYYGIRVIPGSELIQQSEDGNSAVRQQ
jgi:regulatory factor X 1/2/3